MAKKRLPQIYADLDLSPPAIKRIRAAQERTRKRVQDHSGYEPPLAVTIRQNEAKREAYGKWKPPAFVRRETERARKPLKRCDSCKAGRHCNSPVVCSCRCPK